MGWKIYLLVMGTLGIFGWSNVALHPASASPLSWVHLPVDALALVGLFGYAFRRELLNTWVWRIVALIILVLLPLDVMIMIKANLARAAPPSIGIIAGAAAISVALTAPMAFALLSYGQRLATSGWSRETPT